MTDSRSPVFGIPWVVSQQAQPEVTLNEALLLIQAVIGGVIAQQNAPPGSPTAGAAYLVGTSPTGAWAGKANKVVIYYGGWKFLPGVDSDGIDIPIGPSHEGLSVWVRSTDARVTWDGSAWV